MDSWRSQEAEAQFGEMLERCLAKGPQFVTRDGAEAAVLVPTSEWMGPTPAVGERQKLRSPRRPSRKDVLMANCARGDIPMPNLDGVTFKVVPIED